ncbi:hypothetical protein CDAR_451851 [Caerostris darwini]|uniref:Uncharacterized protein n=1 Tax=Caerostris darwini TaxID=1538125 RepID=A0AAV4W102_9ARAC|nr:hypothetical protein CDAR_451851 [Caerostris darwini]
MTSVERGTLITMYCGIDDIGNFIPPFFICLQVNMKDVFLKCDLPGPSNGANPAGLMPFFLKHYQMQHGKHVDDLRQSRKSHLTSFPLLALRQLYCASYLPIHTSYNWKPPNRAVYELFGKYNITANEWLLSYSGQPISIHDEVEIAGKAFSNKNIHKRVEFYNCIQCTIYSKRYYENFFT